MTWVALSLAAAIFQAGQFAYVKGQTRGIPPIVLVFWTQVVGAAGWLLYVLVARTPIHIPSQMWKWIAFAAAVAALYGFLLARASTRGDISIVGPVLALAPVFSILPDWWLTGALPRGLGWVGVALSIAGTAGLSRTPTRRLDLHGLFSRGDALDALGAAMLLGLLAGLDRLNVLSLGAPSYFIPVYAIMVGLTLTAALIRAPRGLAASLAPARFPRVLYHGLLVTIGTAFQVIALSFAPAAYVTSIRRSSAIFSVVLGSVLFNEEGLRARLTSAVLAVLGAVCLVLAR